MGYKSSFLGFLSNLTQAIFVSKITTTVNRPCDFTEIPFPAPKAWNSINTIRALSRCQLLFHVRKQCRYFCWRTRSYTPFRSMSLLVVWTVIQKVQGWILGQCLFDSSDVFSMEWWMADRVHSPNKCLCNIECHFLWNSNLKFCSGLWAYVMSFVPLLITVVSKNSIELSNSFCTTIVNCISSSYEFISFNTVCVIDIGIYVCQKCGLSCRSSSA